MTLQELGNLGEFIAAIGLMFSLIFVGWEIRKTRRQSTVDGAEIRLNLFNEFNRLLITNPDLRDVWLRSHGDLHEFNEEEQFIFGHLMTLRFTIFVRMFVRGTELKDKESIDAAKGLLKDQFSEHPNAVGWWRQNKSRWRGSFREFVDEVLHD